jgi:hypothetical protein
VDLKLPSLLLLSLTLLAGACSEELPDYDPNCDDGQCDRASARRGHASKIRDTAAQAGITNSVLLAGIGQVETNLAHCWTEAKWACKGPASASCGGGPVIAGASDGACSLKRGGLGMFQFDAGNHNDTIAKYGADIVTIEGNVAEVVPFLIGRAIESVDGINSEKEAIDWINSIPIVDGDPDFEKWLEFVSWRYNGCKGCTSQENKYRNGSHLLHEEFGSEFWGSIGDTGGGGLEEGDNNSFIGTDCSETIAVCDFTNDGVESQCIDWFNADDGQLNGFCSLACQGTCPDKTGEAPTYCADFKNDPGYCASVPDSTNGFCTDLPGTILQVVPRFIGTSGAAQGWKGVCAPPGNATVCDAGGQSGECIDTESMQCGGTLHTGLCPGKSNIKCCTL